MTQDLLVDAGEEYFFKEVVDGATLTVGLYLDADDNLGETSTIADISTEPSNDNYSTESATFTAEDFSGNWGVGNDSLLEYDFSDTTDQNMEVDTAYVTATFDSADNGSTGDHLIANPALSQLRKVGSIDTLEIQANDLKIKLD